MCTNYVVERTCTILCVMFQICCPYFSYRPWFCGLLHIPCHWEAVSHLYTRLY